MKVAVIGGGIAGAELIRVASPCPLQFTLIEPKKQIEMQALYPEYLGGVARLQDLAAPLKPFCERVGATHIQEKALRLEGNTVVCEKSRVEFDYVVVATGAAQNYFGIKGVENTFSINTLEETKKARRFVEDNYPERIMIMGSGLTGVEAASILAESLDASIYIIEAKDRVLPQFSPQTSELVEKALSKKGVNILTSTQVAEVKEDCIMFHGRHLPGLRHGHLDGRSQALSIHSGSGPAQEERLDTGGPPPQCQRECLCHRRLRLGRGRWQAGHQDRPGSGAAGQVPGPPFQEPD